MNTKIEPKTKKAAPKTKTGPKTPQPKTGKAESKPRNFDDQAFRILLGSYLQQHLPGFDVGKREKLADFLVRGVFRQIDKFRHDPHAPLPEETKELPAEGKKKNLLLERFILAIFNAAEEATAIGQPIDEGLARSSIQQGLVVARQEVPRIGSVEDLLLVHTLFSSQAGKRFRLFLTLLPYWQNVLILWPSIEEEIRQNRTENALTMCQPKTT